MSVAAAGPRARPTSAWTQTAIDRVAAAVPILTVFFWLALVYCWESWGHVAPWVFVDELQNAQLSRAIADTGHAARRGEAHSFDSLFNYLIAPAWWLNDMHRAYSAVKYIGAVTMTTVVFPTYWLARLAVSRPAALLAAAGAGAVPALVYSSFLLEEPLAYPYTALCFFLIAKALVVRRTRWWVLAIVACAIAPLVRSQLAVVPAVLVLATLLRGWGAERMQLWRSTWSTGDWVGALTLIAGAAIFVNAFISHHFYAWLIATLFYKHRMIEYGLWAAGALTIGLGVFPVVAGLASLIRPRGGTASEGERAFACTAAAGIGAFGFYTAVKASYLSTIFSTLVEERNIIYVAPLLMVGSALLLERGRSRFLAVAAAAGFTLYLVLSTPLSHMNDHFYFDAPGYSILQGANQKWGWTMHTGRTLLISLFVVSLLVIMLPRYLRPWSPTLVRGIAVFVGVCVIAWNVTAELSAATSSKYYAELISQNIAPPLDWLDPITHGAPTIYLGQNITDPTGVQELEFWNRSIRWMWSLDGSALKVGAPILTPNVGQVRGRLSPAPRDAKFVVADEGVVVVGQKVGTHAHYVGGSQKLWTVYRIAEPLRLQQVQGGDLYDDGWMGTNSTYTQFATPHSQRGYALVTVTRGLSGFSTRTPLTIRLGRVYVGADQKPHLGRLLVPPIHYTLGPRNPHTFAIPAPAPPFRVEITAESTFVPHTLDPRTADIRPLSALVGFGWSHTPPRKAATK